MKQLFFGLAVFCSINLSAQSTVVNFSGNTITAENKAALSNAKLPLRLNFTFSDFKEKTVEITATGGQTVIPQKVFKGGVQKDAGTGDFKITIAADRTTNLGEAKVNENEFILKIGSEKIPVKLVSDENTSGTTTTPKTDGPSKSEDYEAGYVYYDALKLADPKVIPQTKKEILAAYGIDSSNYNKNPYIKNLMAEKSISINAEGGAAALLATFGSKDVTYAAAGLARLIAERAKEELNDAFFRRMRNKLIAYPELATVFPKTTSLMKIIDTYAYTNVIQALREAFEADMRNLPEDVYQVKNLNKFSCMSIEDSDDKTNCETRMATIDAFFKSQPGKWTALAMFTAKESPVAANPSALLNAVSQSTELSELKTSVEKNSKGAYNALSSVELSNLLSQSLLSKDEDKVWISSNELGQLFTRKNAFRAYLGLLLAKEMQKEDNKKITFYKKDNTPTTFQSVLYDHEGNYTNFESLIRNSHTAYNTANNAIKKIEAAMNNASEADPQALYNYYKTFTASVKPIVQNPLLKSIVGDSMEARYLLVESYLNPSVDLVYHLSVKQYSSAVFDASILLDKLTANNDKLKPVAKSFIKYGTLISTVATAQNSDEVKAALNAAVLPAGSYSIKRNSAWSISINSYVGGYYGKVYATARDTQWNASTGKFDTISRKVTYKSYGLHAPVGVAFSRGSKCGFGVSIIAQLIDVGALVNYYLINGDQTALPNDFKISLSNIVAPGAQLGINIPKTPITLLGGVQHVPALYRTDQITSGSTITASHGWRVQAGVVIDIPLFNIGVRDFKK